VYTGVLRLLHTLIHNMFAMRRGEGNWGARPLFDQVIFVY